MKTSSTVCGARYTDKTPLGQNPLGQNPLGQNPSRTKPLALMIKVDKTPHILFWDFFICKQN